MGLRQAVSPSRQVLGTATQIGISLGVALAHRDAGRLVVDLQPDGDLMFDAGALWVAAKHRIPLLVVMHNNRAYYNDWEHQIRMARQRARRSSARTSAWTWSTRRPISRRWPNRWAGTRKALSTSLRKFLPRSKRAIERVKAGQPAFSDTIYPEAMSETVGVVGAGRMGLPIIGPPGSGPASHLATDVDFKKQPEVERQAALWVPDATSLARECDIVIVCVGFDREVRELLARAAPSARRGADRSAPCLSNDPPEDDSGFVHAKPRCWAGGHRLDGLPGR